MVNLGITPPQKKKRRKSTLLRLIGFLFTAGVFVFLAGTATAAYYLWVVSKDLPDYEGLARWEPAVVTRVHANDGSLIAEYARERRIYVPINAIPQKVINAFLAAEDKNFYKHNGVDPEGIARALYTDITSTGFKDTAVRSRALRRSPSRWRRTSCFPTSRSSIARSRN